MQERDAGRDDLAGKVEQVSETVGDGLGYDVLSFEAANSSKKLVEVKTTVWGPNVTAPVTFGPRMISRNPVQRRVNSSTAETLENTGENANGRGRDPRPPVLTRLS